MRRLVGGVALAAVGFLAVLVVEAVIARRGDAQPFTEAPRTPQTFGASGPRLTYVVLGDSTGAGQGAPYDAGIAVATARHLASAGRRVSLVNLSVSGAKLADVVAEQLPLAVRLRPDVVLVSAGANDVTGLTSTGAVREAVESLAARLREVSPGVRIVLTASPDVASSPRLAQPLRWVTRLRTRQVNAAFREVAAARGLTVAPIAARTGPQFERDRGLFSADRYHPNARGYATWVPPLTEALDRAGA